MGFRDFVLNLFRPSWRHSNFFVRIDAIHKLTNVNTLFKIMRNDTVSEVRVAALKRIKAPEHLIEVIRTIPSCREMAARKIKDQALLADLARSSEPELRWAALFNLSNENQALFTELAENDPDRKVRKKSISRLNDKKLLLRISANKKDKELRIAADKRLQKLRSEELENMDDPVKLSNILANNKNTKFRLRLIRKISNEEVLARAACLDKDEQVWKAAIGRIQKEETLLTIALDEKVPYERRDKAFQRVRSQENLAKVAINGGDWNMAFEAVPQITKVSLLKQIVLYAKSSLIRSEAVKNIDEEEFAVELAKSSPEESIRAAAVKSITDQKVIESLLSTESSSRVRADLVWKLKNPKMRHNLANNDPDVIVRSIAALPLEGKCGDCGRSVDITNAKMKSSKGDYHTMVFLYCPMCIREEKSLYFQGRLRGKDGKDLLYQYPGGEWG